MNRRSLIRVGALAAVSAAAIIALRTGALGPGPADPAPASSACQGAFDGAPETDPGRAPEGWASALTLRVDGDIYRYGPIIGHYWLVVEEPRRLCGLHYNTDGAYSSDAPRDALLYTVEGRLTKLPITSAGRISRMRGPQRQIGIEGREAPSEWVETMPAPGYRYWHSLYDPGERRPAAIGYWLRHSAVRSFTFDMDGITAQYGHTHHVTPGIDRRFAFKFNFDGGPRGH